MTRSDVKRFKSLSELQAIFLVLSLLMLVFGFSTCEYNPALSCKASYGLVSSKPASFSFKLAKEADGVSLNSPISSSIARLSFQGRSPRFRKFEDQVNYWVRDICKLYPNVDPELVMSVIYHESRYDPTVISSAKCVGLMQVSIKWQTARAKSLGVSDLMDPYSNILVGVDLLSELLENSNGDVAYALMCYNMGAGNAKPLYEQGVVSSYARSVMSRQSYLEVQQCQERVL